MYALNLDTDNRILSVTLDQYAPAEQPRVETIPEDNVTDYKYIDNEFVYDPMPQPEPPEPQPILEDQVEQNRADIDFIAMMSDIEL